MRPVKFQRIGFNQIKRLRKSFFKPGGEISVNFNSGFFSRAFNHFAGKRGLPRTDFHNGIAGLRIDRARDALNPMLVVQEILPETFTSPMPGQSVLHD